MSTNYATTSAAKSSSANSANQTTNQTETTTQPAKDYPYVDVVTFSQEALEASEKLSVKDSEQRILDLSPPEEKKYWYNLLERNNSKTNSTDNNTTNNESVLSSTKYTTRHDPVKLIYAMDTLNISKIYSNKWQDTTTKIDERITAILNENNIALTKDETLNFTIKNGKITIDKGISEYKKTILEKIFNEDKELRADLIESHIFLAGSDPNIRSYNTGQQYIIDHDPKVLPFVSLMRNYGLTADDFVFTSEEERLNGALSIKFKDGTNHDEMLLDMFIDDAKIYDYIEGSLEYEQNFGKKSLDYEYSFSYKNGVTIEKGVGDQYSLDKRYQFILDDRVTNILPNSYDRSNVAVTLNPDGEIVDAEIIEQLAYTGPEEDKYNITKENFDLFTIQLNKRSVGTNNTPEYQPWYKQYVFEAQRLAKYKSGEDTSKMNLVINRTFLNKEITNGRRS
jgi:hypothetical protein